MINLDLERGRADTHDEQFMSQAFLECDGYHQRQYVIATNSYFAQQMPSVNDSLNLSMALPVNDYPPWMNPLAESLPNSSKYEEIKDDIRVSNKEERIYRANYLLEELQRKITSKNYKPQKVYGDALYKALLRQLRRWVRNLLDPVLLNAKPN